jgi:hypothetical protein
VHNTTREIACAVIFRDERIAVVEELCCAGLRTNGFGEAAKRIIGQRQTVGANGAGEAVYAVITKLIPAVAFEIAPRIILRLRRADLRVLVLAVRRVGPGDVKVILPRIGIVVPALAVDLADAIVAKSEFFNLFQPLDKYILKKATIGSAAATTKKQLNTTSLHPKVLTSPAVHRHAPHAKPYIIDVRFNDLPVQFIIVMAAIFRRMKNNRQETASNRLNKTPLIAAKKIKNCVSLYFSKSSFAGIIQNSFRCFSKSCPGKNGKHDINYFIFCRTW